jgi:Flp pilus assembly protein TadB
MEIQILTTLVTQCPVLFAFIWFLITITKENNRRMSEMSEQFQTALDKVVNKISDRLERIETTLKRWDEE